MPYLPISVTRVSYVLRYFFNLISTQSPSLFLSGPAVPST